MKLRVAKWGNGLAVRLPADYVRRTGVKVGDTLQASLTIDGGLSIRAHQWDRKAFAQELSEACAKMPVGQSVIEELRRGTRY
jgi:antitoxin MazE